MLINDLGNNICRTYRDLPETAREVPLSEVDLMPCRYFGPFRHTTIWVLLEVLEEACVLCMGCRR